jgi:hypothetical protein
MAIDLSYAIELETVLNTSRLREGLEDVNKSAKDVGKTVTRSFRDANKQVNRQLDYHKGLAKQSKLRNAFLKKHIKQMKAQYQWEKKMGLMSEKQLARMRENIRLVEQQTRQQGALRRSAAAAAGAFGVLGGAIGSVYGWIKKLVLFPITWLSDAFGEMNQLLEAFHTANIEAHGGASELADSVVELGTELGMSTKELTKHSLAAVNAGVSMGKANEEIKVAIEQMAMFSRVTGASAQSIAMLRRRFEVLGEEAESVNKFFARTVEIQEAFGFTGSQLNQILSSMSDSLFAVQAAYGIEGANRYRRALLELSAGARLAGVDIRTATQMMADLAEDPLKYVVALGEDAIYQDPAANMENMVQKAADIRRQMEQWPPGLRNKLLKSVYGITAAQLEMLEGVKEAREHMKFLGIKDPKSMEKQYNESINNIGKQWNVLTNTVMGLKMSALTPIYNMMQDVLDVAVQMVRAFASPLVSAFKEVRGTFEGIGDAFEESGLRDALVEVSRLVGELIATDIKEAFGSEGAKSLAESMKISAAFIREDIVPAIKDWFASGKFKRLLTGVRNVIDSIRNTVKGWMDSLKSDEAKGKTMERLGKALSSVETIIHGVAYILGGIVDAIKWIANNPVTSMLIAGFAGVSVIVSKVAIELFALSMALKATFGKSMLSVVRGVFTSAGSWVMRFGGVVKSVFMAIPGYASSAFAAVSGVVKSSFAFVGGLIAKAAAGLVAIVGPIAAPIIAVAGAVASVGYAAYKAWKYFSDSAYIKKTREETARLKEQTAEARKEIEKMNKEQQMGKYATKESVAKDINAQIQRMKEEGKSQEEIHQTLQKDLEAIERVRKTEGTGAQAEDIEKEYAIRAELMRDMLSEEAKAKKDIASAQNEAAEKRVNKEKKAAEEIIKKKNEAAGKRVEEAEANKAVVEKKETASDIAENIRASQRGITGLDLAPEKHIQRASQDIVRLREKYAALKNASDLAPDERAIRERAMAQEIAEASHKYYNIDVGQQVTKDPEMLQKILKAKQEMPAREWDVRRQKWKLSSGEMDRGLMGAELQKSVAEGALERGTMLVDTPIQLERRGRADTAATKTVTPEYSTGDRESHEFMRTTRDNTAATKEAISETNTLIENLAGLLRDLRDTNENGFEDVSQGLHSRGSPSFMNSY